MERKKREREREHASIYFGTLIFIALGFGILWLLSGQSLAWLGGVGATFWCCENGDGQSD